jgi:putative MATE family efflux protein
MNHKVFESYSIPKSVFAMGIPSIVGSLVMVLYNMADTFFIGQIGDPNQVAAVSIILPIFTLFIAIGALFGVGGASLISRSLGKGDYNMVKRASAFCFYGCIGAGLLATVIFQFFMDTILSFLGAGEETTLYARNYFSIISYGAVFILMQNMFTTIVRSEGAARVAMIGQMIGTFVNIVLDPLFVLVFRMGTTGVAIATVIGTFLVSLYYLFYLKFGKSVLSISLAKFSFDSKLVKEIFGIGFPASLTMFIMSISYLTYNKVLVGYGAIVVSASAIASRGGMFSDCFQTGMAMGVQPLVGYHYAANNYKKMRGIIRFTILVTVLIGVCFFTGLMVFAPRFVRVFINNDEIVGIGSNFLRIFILTTPVAGIAFTLQNVFQGMGKIIQAMILTFGRQVIFLVTIFLGHYFGGMYGVISAQPLAIFVSMTLSVIMYLSILKTQKETMG